MQQLINYLYVCCIIGSCAKVESTNGVITAVVSSATVFLLTSIIMLIIGFVYGHWFSQQHACKLTSTRAMHTTNRQPVENQHQDVVLRELEPVCIDPQEQGLNMTENVAYVSTVMQI